jgi:hypothetical protein
MGRTLPLMRCGAGGGTSRLALRHVRGVVGVPLRGLARNGSAMGYVVMVSL